MLVITKEIIDSIGYQLSPEMESLSLAQQKTFQDTITAIVEKELVAVRLQEINKTLEHLKEVYKLLTDEKSKEAIVQQIIKLLNQVN